MKESETGKGIHGRGGGTKLEERAKRTASGNFINQGFLIFSKKHQLREKGKKK